MGSSIKRREKQAIKRKKKQQAQAQARVLIEYVCNYLGRYVVCTHHPRQWNHTSQVDCRLDHTLSLYPGKGKLGPKSEEKDWLLSLLRFFTPCPDISYGDTRLASYLLGLETKVAIVGFVLVQETNSVGIQEINLL